MTPKAVIFDWAGTMVDFGSLAPVVAMQHAFTQMNVPITEPEARLPMGQAKRDHVLSILAIERVRQAWIEQYGQAPAAADADHIFASLDSLMREAGAARATLIPGARSTFDQLRAKGIRIGSTTGYTRPMMVPIQKAAAAQGYEPEIIVCAGETLKGRPAPLIIWKAMVELGVYPAAEVVVVDDSIAGIEAGRAAGCFTVGIAASGNGVGLDLPQFQALSASELAARVQDAREALLRAGADKVIDTVAGLPDVICL
ncbi:phosphonoacetaldehyde hydrolase [Asticcacaulis tiandongensis]|uniref:phosphonoacetaldehyde hydrolase n=1 Tax=Asticcacaulis tiandongensis TaxID=2565365 RepID=UPI0011293390|nr:phosphonoacetaldehyde hydrolase [Asticcacaulis tiandongensis]